MNWAIITALILGFNQFYDEIANTIAKYHANPTAFYLSIVIICGFAFYNYAMGKITNSIINICDYIKTIIEIMKEGVSEIKKSNAINEEILKRTERREKDNATDFKRRKSDVANND